jgi:hypothetical protein
MRPRSDNRRQRAGRIIRMVFKEVHSGAASISTRCTAGEGASDGCYLPRPLVLQPQLGRVPLPAVGEFAAAPTTCDLTPRRSDRPLCQSPARTAARCSRRGLFWLQGFGTIGCGAGRAGIYQNPLHRVWFPLLISIPLESGHRWERLDLPPGLNHKYKCGCSTRRRSALDTSRLAYATR